jgi:hypothetical protein
MALYWSQGPKKKNHQIGEANLQPLGPIRNSKMLKVSPKFFWPLTLRVKSGLTTFAGSILIILFKENLNK